MTAAEHHYYWPDRAKHCTVSIEENVQLARETYRVRFACPEIARQIVPGQFLMLRLASSADPLLGRPLALYDVVPNPENQPHSIDVVYLTMGKLTTLLAECPPGRELEVWGPLGNGFAPKPVQHLIMVAGGIGQTPFLALAKEALGQAQYGSDRVSPWAEKVTFCYGARTASYLAGLEDFAAAGVQVLTSTDDGSAGLHGQVTGLLPPLLAASDRTQTRVVCCGPEPMMKAVAEQTAAAEVACEVSLETPMACGLGICFSCVAKVRTTSKLAARSPASGSANPTSKLSACSPASGPANSAEGEWDYRRTCVEGPVFDARQIVFD